MKGTNLAGGRLRSTIPSYPIGPHFRQENLPSGVAGLAVQSQQKPTPGSAVLYLRPVKNT